MAERDIIFRVGGQEFGFDVTCVTAIESVTEIVAVPGAPRCILGIMNLRGEVIPVFGLRRRFGFLEKEKDANTKLIVVKTDGNLLAFLVDEVLEMKDFTEEQLTLPPVITRSESTDCIRMIANKKGKLVLLLNPASMYEGNEEAQMEKLMARMK